MSIPANVINATDYQAIEQNLTYAILRGKKSSDDMYDATYTILLNDQMSPQVDLLNAFYNSYVSVSNTVTNNAVNSGIGDAIRALQSHVIARSGGAYSSINDYYADGGIQVYESFADISASVGYVIDETLYVIADPVL